MRRIFAVPAYRRYWLGDLCGGILAEVVQVAVMWYLTSYGHSPQALGLYSFFADAPVAPGGVLVAQLFRRCKVRSVMMLDLVARSLGYAVLAGCLLAGRGHGVPFWTFDLVAAVTALFVMAPSAGGPSLWPRLLPKAELGHAMQSEQFGWNLSSAVGPLLAGALVTAAGLPAIALAAALLFAGLGLNLATLRLEGPDPQATEAEGKTPQASLLAVWRIVARERALLLPTVLFWVLNLVGGMQGVFLPLIVHTFWQGPAWLYGALLGTAALSGLLGSITLASAQGGDLLRKVMLGELAASLASLLLVPGLRSPLFAFAALGISSAISAATATWVLQLRFDATGERERPVVLAYIRTALYSASPLGALVAGGVWRPASAAAWLAGGSGLMFLAALVGLAAAGPGRRNAAVGASR